MNHYTVKVFIVSIRGDVNNDSQTALNSVVVPVRLVSDLKLDKHVILCLSCWLPLLPEQVSKVFLM